MNIVEAKVHAATISKTLNEIVQIVSNSKDPEDFLLDVADTHPKAITWFKHGCEKGKGYLPPVSKNDEPVKKRKKSAAELIEGMGSVKAAKVKKAKEVPAGAEVRTWQQLRAEVLKKNVVFNSSGKSIPCTVRAEQTPEKEVFVKITVKGKQKQFNII